METIIINHQLINRNIFLPNWPIKYLFLGTFNPEGGADVNYYYGRTKNGKPVNQTWPTLSIIFGRNLDVNSAHFFQDLKELEIGCIDLIQSVQISKKDELNVTGKSYKDSNIINNKVVRKYNTNAILEVIYNNPNVKIYSTWGKGSNLEEWKIEVSKFRDITNLVSPSLAARVPKGSKKTEFILNDWLEKIKLSENIL